MSSTTQQGRMKAQDLPEGFRARLEARFGLDLAGATDLAGGASPGPVFVAEDAAGRPVLGKVCPLDAPYGSADLLLHETQVSRALPAVDAVPAFLGGGVHQGYRYLLREFVPGTQPAAPWDERVFRTCFHTLGSLSQSLQGVRPPSVPTVAESSNSIRSTWQHLPSLEGSVDPWWLQEWVSGLAADAVAQVQGADLCHWDIRSDNLVCTADRVLVVDWGQAKMGAPWIDRALLFLDAATNGADLDLAAFFARSGLPARAVLSLFAAVGMSYEVKAACADNDFALRMRPSYQRWAAGCRAAMTTIRDAGSA
ncbi:Phosphotransferase enzyme family protein [Kytococcus aerolatus]|uniref:Phosphotransferase enzyme family protein n=1 Tax=Kytococcus aerolatus TaxID=592308 RepID=A0A212U0D6_9MICO|nr:aminoglycoside phosphotransferase family protein [Kytococcus aerolatus]SNC71594.1 Phosphotransferase enzyme family protein [Kytococcus aerolatus]